MTTHQLPFGAAISAAVLAYLGKAAADVREHDPEMFPEIRLVERCEDVMASLRGSERLPFYSEPVNRLAAYAARTAPPLEWAIFLLERKFAHSLFRVGEIEVEIGEEAQAALKGKVLDVVDGKIVVI